MDESFGYTGKILWIDLTRRTCELEERDEIFWRRYAGGGLVAARLLLEKTPAGIDPLGYLLPTSWGCSTTTICQVAAKSCSRCQPRQMAVMPGSPSDLRPKNPPSLAIQWTA